MAVITDITSHAMSSGYNATTDWSGGTTFKRDVSEMLDLWAHKMTPFLNRLSWGAESGGLTLEWISEHLGWGYIESNAAFASGGSALVKGFTDPAGVSAGNAEKAMQDGCMLYAYNTDDDEDFLGMVESIGSSDTIFVMQMLTSSVAASTKFYILGNVANEGSDPRVDNSRTRSVLSNKFVILREDVNVTGSMDATDMHAVPEGESRHQIKMRLLEMQRNREMQILYSAKSTARSTTDASTMKGIYGFLRGESGSHIDSTTTSLTEDAFNDVVAEIWDNQGSPNVVVGSQDQIRKIVQWDATKIRRTPDDRTAGTYFSRYLTDVGEEVELLPLRKVPKNILMVLDTSKISPRAKRGRKLILEKLAKTGDYDMWQMLSEFSLEMRGYDKGQHGMFSNLA